MSIIKAGKILSADIVHTDSGLLGGKPPEYYAKEDQTISLWQSKQIYTLNDLCYENGVIYKSKADSNSSLVTDTEKWEVYGDLEEVKNLLNKKVEKVEGKGLSTVDFTTEKDEKLTGVEDNANNYIHPDNHPASMITGLATVATSGSYDDLKDKPAVGGGGGKKYHEVVIGCSEYGHKASDVDYLCDRYQDEEQIQAAINFVSENGSHAGVISFLHGYYNCNLSYCPTITLANCISFYGNGSTLLLSQSASPCFSATGTLKEVVFRDFIFSFFPDSTTANNIVFNFEGVENVIFENCHFDCTANNIITTCILFGNAKNVDFIRCTFTNAIAAIKSNAADVADSVTIDNCYFNCKTHNRQIDIANPTSLVISNNSFYGCSGIVLSHTGGIDSSKKGISIIGNTMDCVTKNGTAIEIQECDVSIVGNTIINYTTGMNIFGSSAGLASNVSISGNVIHDFAAAGIKIQYNRKTTMEPVTVTGNTIIKGKGLAADYNTSTWTILMNSHNCLITGNVLMGKDVTDTGTNNIKINNKIT